MDLYEFLKICDSDIKDFLLSRVLALSILKRNAANRKIIYGQLIGFLDALCITNAIRAEQRCILLRDIEYVYERGDLPF